VNVRSTKTKVNINDHIWASDYGNDPTLAEQAHRWRLAKERTIREFAEALS
jgi:hypothetical protein